MNNIKDNTIIQRKSEILSSELDGETVLMSAENGEYLGLDDIGSRIWQLIEKSITFEILIDHLIKEYKVNRIDCEKDVLEFLEGLLNKQLIIIS